MRARKKQYAKLQANIRERERVKSVLKIPLDKGGWGILTGAKIALTSLLAALASAGVIYAATTIGTNITTTGTLNVTATTTIDTDTFFVDVTNNRVGIGTTTPEDTLSVQGNSYLHGLALVYGSAYIYNYDDPSEEASLTLDGTFNPTNSSARISLTGTTSRVMIQSGETLWPTTWSLGINTGLEDSPNQNFQIREVANGSGLVDVARLTIEKVNGYVGIGTTTPQYKLDVNGDVNIASGTVYRIGGSAILNASSTLFNLYGGFNSGKSITTGYWNTFYGIGSGESNTVGNYNTFLGLSAGIYNISGNNNTFIGGNSGQNNTTGDGNTFLGETSGVNNTSGGYNTFLGWSSGSANTFGSRNSFIGYQSGANNTTGENNVFIGYQAAFNETGSNKLYITNSNTTATSSLIYGEFDNNLLSFNAKVGVGTSTPATKLEIHDTATSTVSIISETAGSGGRIILEDSDGAGCSEIYILDGVISSAAIACPSN